MASVSLLDESIMYDKATQLGDELRKKGKFEEERVFFLAALEGSRRVLGEEHKNTLDSLNNMGAVLQDLKDYEGALVYY